MPLLLLGALAAAGCGERDGAGPADRGLAARAEAMRVHCPAPASIRSTRIPTSFNAVYYARTEGGIAFDGLDLAGLAPATMRLVQAKVDVAGGVWRLYCDYFGATSRQRLSLASAGASRYQSCRFPDGATSCSGSLADCVFLCPANAP